MTDQPARLFEEKIPSSSSTWRHLVNFPFNRNRNKYHSLLWLSKYPFSGEYRRRRCHKRTRPFLSFDSARQQSIIYIIQNHSSAWLEPNSKITVFCRCLKRVSKRWKIIGHPLPLAPPAPSITTVNETHTCFIEHLKWVPSSHVASAFTKCPFSFEFFTMPIIYSWIITVIIVERTRAQPTPENWLHRAFAG